MVSVEHLVICDDVRMEFTGKLIIVGMYLDSILVPEFPFSIHGLTLLQVYAVKGTAPAISITVRLRQKETRELLGENEGTFSVTNPGMLVSIVKLDVTFASAGRYCFEVHPEGENPIEKDFSVTIGSLANVPTVRTP